MKFLLLQNSVYMPSFGGGNKSNRLLLEALAERGHVCATISKALCAQQVVNPTSEEVEMPRRGVTVETLAPGFNAYRFRGVQVDAIDFANVDAFRDHIRRRIDQFQPDWILVSDDKDGTNLELALEAAAGRVVLVVHTNLHLPFGPESTHVCARRTKSLRDVTGILVASEYIRQYLRKFAALESTHLPFPVYGQPPFQKLGQFGRGAVTLINPCEIKGVAIFLGLAREFSHTPFLAVPTWGADEAVMASLNALPNVQIVEAADDIEEILRRTKVLLAPSLIPETFGYVVVDAMLRGIPCLASDLGGLREAMLGVDYLVPVAPATCTPSGYRVPRQDLEPWRRTLNELLTSRETYEERAHAAQTAATAFVSPIDVAVFEAYFQGLKDSRRASVQIAEQATLCQPSVVVVVDPYESGALLAPEFARHGYHAVAVLSRASGPVRTHQRLHREDFQEVIDEEDAATVLAELRRWPVMCVVPGNESGVVLADRLSVGLDLPSNGTFLSTARRDKFRMAEIVGKASLAVPAQHGSRQRQELVDWAHHRNEWPVVVKPPRSTGSDGVSLCHDVADVAAAFDRLWGNTNRLGEVNDNVLVQEFVAGTEFAVDTVSCRGRHRIVAIWQYEKPTTRFMGVVPFIAKRFVSPLEETPRKVGQYVLRVLDALGIRHGPAHAEVIWRRGTPCLLEIGARMHGGAHAMVLSRACLGTSQVEATVAAYARPDDFLAIADVPYELRRHGTMALLLPHSTGTLAAIDTSSVESLSSFRRLHLDVQIGQPLPRIAGLVEFVHEDQRLVDEDVRALRQLERQGIFRTS